MSRRAPQADLLVTLREALRGDDRAGAGATFMRGLTLGALIGAAIAGSALWQRRARRVPRLLDRWSAGDAPGPAESSRQLHR
jgi:hypothetical protein